MENSPTISPAWSNSLRSSGARLRKKSGNRDRATSLAFQRRTLLMMRIVAILEKHKQLLEERDTDAS